MINRIVLTRSLVLLLISATAAFAQEPAQGSTNPKEMNANELVRETVANEVASSNTNGIKHMFRDRKSTPKGTTTRLYVETCDAMAGMTVAANDKPLSEKELQNEEGRLAGLLNNPDQLKRKQREQKEDADRTLKIVKALPDAFVYQIDGTVPGTSKIGREGAELVRLKFHPNPAYRPPSHEEEVLLGMQGTLLIDPQEKRIAQIDGILFEPVSFGWGILGKLDRGGHFLVDQADVGQDSWEVSQMTLNFTGKILMFKSLVIKSDEVFSDFRRVPNQTTFAEGVKMLEAQVSKNESRGAETAKVEASSKQ